MVDWIANGRLPDVAVGGGGVKEGGGDGLGALDVDSVAAPAAFDRQAGRVVVLVVDVGGGRQAGDVAPAGFPGGDGSHMSGVDAGVGRVVDGDGRLVLRVLDIWGAQDALDAHVAVADADGGCHGV